MLQAAMPRSVFRSFLMKCASYAGQVLTSQISPTAFVSFCARPLISRAVLMLSRFFLRPSSRFLHPQTQHLFLYSPLQMTYIEFLGGVHALLCRKSNSKREKDFFKRDSFSRKKMMMMPAVVVGGYICLASLLAFSSLPRQMRERM